MGVPAVTSEGEERTMEAAVLLGVRVDRLAAAEPTAWVLVVVGLLALALIRRRRT